MNGYKCGISGKYPYKLFRWSKLQFYFMSLGRNGGYDIYCTYYYVWFLINIGVVTISSHPVSVQYTFYRIQLRVLLYPVQ